ncbi:MAG: RHS repeat protein [Nitrospira sp.]|nr:RHS repeat protein [Nitrospira sp.]
MSRNIYRRRQLVELLDKLLSPISHLDSSSVTDQKGQITSYTYDPLNRRTKTTFQDGTSTNYTYDAGNRITQVQEKNSGGTVTATITRTYDGLDRLTQEVTPQGQIDYTYDNASRRATMTVAGQPQVTYTYDNANRLTTITQNTSTVTIGYDDADRRTSVTYPNTNSITYAYNAASELTSLTYKQGATTLGDLTYTYDAAGNRLKTGGTFARSNIPPALTSASYNANNQQTTFGTSTETYGLNGNLATSTDAGVTTTYTWNARNQLTGVSSSSLTASFTYDSFGRRSGKTINGTMTNFVYDGLNPVQEENGGTVTANLLTGLGIDEFFTRTDGVGVRALLPDALGSTVALGDGTGTLQTQYTYEPFGFTTQTGAASTNSYKYTGREDDGTGLAYYRARYYHPRLQRFMTEDPIGFAGRDVNLYAYVLNNPTRFVDPLRLCWFRPPTDDYVVGREDSRFVEPGKGIGKFLEDYVPAMHTMGTFHDALVDMGLELGLPDPLINIPTMLGVYIIAVEAELLNSLSNRNEDCGLGKRK